MIFFYIFRLFYLFLLSILSIFSSAILLARKDSNCTNNGNNNNNDSSNNIKVMKQKQPMKLPSVGPKGPGKVFLVFLCPLNLSFLIFTACF